MQALEEGRRIERERLHQGELLSALNTSIYVNSKRSKPPFSSASDFYFFADEESQALTPAVCNAFFGLSREDLLPGWVLGIAPVEEMRKIKTTKTSNLTSPRAFVGQGLLLLLPKLCPEMPQQGIQIGLSICQHPGGLAQVFDIDTSAEYSVIVPKSAEGYKQNDWWVTI